MGRKKHKIKLTHWIQNDGAVSDVSDDEYTKLITMMTINTFMKV